MPQGRPSVTWCPRTAGLARVLAVGASALSGCFGSSLQVGRPEDDHLPPASLGAPSTLACPRTPGLGLPSDPI